MAEYQKSKPLEIVEKGKAIFVILNLVQDLLTQTALLS